MVSRVKTPRSGYTTGACASAAAKAAALFLLGGQERCAPSRRVTIPFPDGSRVAFTARLKRVTPGGACASVIKDAGDDPDVTDGAEIVVEAHVVEVLGDGPLVRIEGGAGVGRVTKPGLPVPVGEAAINAVPRNMIREGVMEAIRQTGGLPEGCGICVTIEVPEGERLAEKTLNARLGIRGGISIIGTTGIVRPLSGEAWTSAIAAAMDVARAMEVRQVVLSTGRASEKAHQERYTFPEEAYVMMGDHVEFSLCGAAARRFTAIHLCAQWAKMLKISLGTPQTHVRHGALNVKRLAAHLARLGIDLTVDQDFNTARALFDHIAVSQGDVEGILRKVCREARSFAESMTGGIPVVTHLVSYEGEIIVDSE